MQVIMLHKPSIQETCAPVENVIIRFWIKHIFIGLSIFNFLEDRKGKETERKTQKLHQNHPIMIFVIKAVSFAVESFTVLLFFLINRLKCMIIKYLERTEAFLPRNY